MSNVCRLIFLLTSLSVVRGRGGEFNRQASEKETERREICMGELGCFKNESPFDEPFLERPVTPLPDDRSEVNTEFRMFTSSNNWKPDVIKNQNFNSSILKKREFLPDANTIFIIHGYLGGDAEWAVRMMNAFMRVQFCNVFIVDWSHGDGPLYEQAVENIRVVGAEVGLFIQKLMTATTMTLDKVHIIGHSLGAHASGYAGKWIKEKEKGKKVKRISGLDPAGPYFNGVDPRIRLDADDAEFVDVIHTNWAGNRLSGFGLYEAIGHFDFYPNGGEDQPGCKTAGEAELGIVATIVPYVLFPFIGNPFEIIDKTLKITTGYYKKEIGDSVEALSCSHGRAYEYYIVSIEDNGCNFEAVECSDWESYTAGKCGSCSNKQCVKMGYYADKCKDRVQGKTKRRFFLTTKDKSPYCTISASYVNYRPSSVVFG